MFVLYNFLIFIIDLPGRVSHLEDVTKGVRIQPAAGFAVGNIRRFLCLPRFLVTINHVLAAPEVGIERSVLLGLHEEFPAEDHDQVKGNTKISSLHRC